MPKSVRQECDDFVNQYADTVIQLLIGALQPNEVCAVLNICSAKNVAVKGNLFLIIHFFCFSCYLKSDSDIF